MRHPRSWLVTLALTAASCGGQQSDAQAPIKKQTAEDEILTVSTAWQALDQERGVRNPPNKIALFEAKRSTVFKLSAGTGSGEEHIEIQEQFEMRDGSRFECRAKASARLRVRYGRKSGQPAVEISRPPLVATRTCSPAGFPEQQIDLGGGSSRFLLSDERLVGFAPTSEKRVFLPGE